MWFRKLYRHTMSAHTERDGEKGRHKNRMGGVAVERNSRARLCLNTQDPGAGEGRTGPEPVEWSGDLFNYPFVEFGKEEKEERKEEGGAELVRQEREQKVEWTERTTPWRAQRNQLI